MHWATVAITKAVRSNSKEPTSTAEGSASNNGVKDPVAVGISEENKKSE